MPDPRQVGWYEHGPIPGEEGAAVLAAHVDLGHVAGIFYHLDDVLLGDRVYIDYDDGSTQVFEVVDDVLYAKTALPADELFRRTGDPVLHLVTCGGVFDPETHHYLGNRVVTARPVD
ncbi:MAG: class F sortase [Acidimicrobiales bacterium]